MNGKTDSARVLIVEDEQDMARVLAYNLGQQGYSVATAGSGEAALACAPDFRPHVVLLDLRLPDMSGLDVLRRLRQMPTLANTPIMIVSALGDEETVVRGLNLGADDYVTKPFRIRELSARVATLWRRSPVLEDEAATVDLGRLQLHPERREAELDGKPLGLTRSEFDILLHLAREPGRVFTRQQLCHQALGSGDAVQERTVDAHVRTIRRKLGDAAAVVATVWGIGYKFDIHAAGDQPHA